MPTRITDGYPNNMPIIAHICDSVKEYQESGEQIIRALIATGDLICQECLGALRIQSWYQRGLKESSETMSIAIIRCRQKCSKGNALLPDFICPGKQYGIKEIENTILQAKEKRVSEIDTVASEATVYRWLAQIVPRITAAVSMIKAVFVGMGAAASEIKVGISEGFTEMESLLDEAPKRLRHSGSTLGLANLWLRLRSPPEYI